MPTISFHEYGTAAHELHDAVLRAKDRKILMQGVLNSAHEVQRQARVNVRERLNKQSTGALSRSIMVEPHEARYEAKVGPTMIYGRIQNEGGIIRPVHGKFLAIPVDRNVRREYAQYTASGEDGARGSLRNAPDLSIATSRNGQWLLVQKYTGVVKFILKQQVTLKATHYLTEAPGQCANKIVGHIRAALVKIFGTGAGDSVKTY